MTPVQLFFAFLRLGAVGFGGPIALIALMEQEFVLRRKLVTLDAFNESYVFCKLLPGPVAVQMSLAVGYRIAGRRGGLAAGLGFVIPGLALIVLLAIFYELIAGVSFIASLLVGMRLGALAIIADSVVRMTKPIRRDLAACAVIPCAAVGFLFFKSWEPVIILLAGFAFVFAPSSERRSLHVVAFPTLALLFLVHFRAGAFVYGTGLAILPFLQEEVVNVYHWLTLPQFLDGIAFGQVTPGPVTVTSAFIGYKAAGLLGAGAAALGMYLPGVILILGVVPWLQEKVRGRAGLAKFQRGAIPAVVGCIVGAFLQLASSEVQGVVPIVAVVSLTALAVWTRWPGWLVLLIGGALGPLIVFLTGKT